MNNYRVYFQSRQIGAIGIFEKSSCLQFCRSSREAYNKTREELYKTREHVLIMKIEVDPDGSGTFETVDPQAYT